MLAEGLSWVLPMGCLAVVIVTVVILVFLVGRWTA